MPRREFARHLRPDQPGAEPRLPDLSLLSLPDPGNEGVDIRRWRCSWWSPIAYNSLKWAQGFMVPPTREFVH